MIRWFVVLIYIVPIIGTLVAMVRRFQSFWSIGESLRKLLPVDRFSRKLMQWTEGGRRWKQKYHPENYFNIAKLNYAAGYLEYAFGHLRDYTIGLTMMACAVVYLTLMVFGSDLHAARYFDRLFYHGFFALLSIWTYRRHVSTGLQMTEFMRANPEVHPQEFFEHYYRRLGPAADPIPARASTAIDPHNISFKSGKPPRQSYWLLLHAFYDTAIFARSATKAMQTMGPVYGREVFDVMAQLWGKRMLQLFRCHLTVKGDELLGQLDGKIILVFNHKSHMDFVFNFFAFSRTRRADGRPILPRYMAAKDHFVDNKFVYEGIGVGKLIESVDMVFVDRKGKGKDAIAQAAEKLATKEIEIAMYPQGTRAYGNKNWHGERQDAGYYTTGSVHALKNELGHLKKGAAFLALDTAISLANGGRSPSAVSGKTQTNQMGGPGGRAGSPSDTNVHLVFIGIEGTANVFPKQDIKIQTEMDVEFNVGSVLTITPADARDLEKPTGEPTTEGQRRYLEWVEKLQDKIDEGLVQALGLHEKLKNRFLEDVRNKNLCPKENLFRLTHHLQESRQKQEKGPFILLDRLYALDPAYWLPHLRTAARLLASDTNPSEELTQLRDQITEQLISTRGKFLKQLEKNVQEKLRLKKSA